MTTLKGQAAQAARNQSDLYEVFNDTDKFTVTELTEKLRAKGIVMSDRTVRRSLDALIRRGSIKSYGRNRSAAIFGKVTLNFTTNPSKAQLINVGGNLVTVEEFLKMFADPEGSPLQKRTPILATDVEHMIRRILLYVVLTSNDTGMDESLAKQNANLNKVIEELDYLHNLLSNYVNSPVWFAQYRDNVGLALRETRKNNPELVALAVEYAKGG